ncbi:MAG TPA: hypothetical protein VL120_00165 [Solirubrobacteraceae bacterium]|nr:hypothetical protein [Solirubrobacteraceae bacterium]
MSRRALAGGACALALAIALGACGTPSPDLFVVHRTGTVPGAKLDLLVSDQSATCNKDKPRELSSAQIITARDILKDLLEFQHGNATVPPAPPAQIFRFSLRDEQGTLRWGDTTQRPSILPRITQFTRDLAIGLCGLQR